jgi:hypothetical protein
MSTPSTCAPRCAAGSAVVPSPAAQVEHLRFRADAQALDEGFAAGPHVVRQSGEVAFFPEGLVRVHGFSVRRSKPARCCE